MRIGGSVPSDDELRLDAVVHYICAFVDNPSQLGATKLNKILWYSDVLAFLNTGESISRSVYTKNKFGPVPKGIMNSRYRLGVAGKVVEREAPFFAYSQTQFIALTKPDISMFTADEIAILDRVAAVIRDDHSAVSISASTHDDVWKCVEIGEEIPLFAVIGSDAGDITEADMSWAMHELEHL